MLLDVLLLLLLLHLVIRHPLISTICTLKRVPLPITRELPCLPAYLAEAQEQDPTPQKLRRVPTCSWYMPVLGSNQGVCVCVCDCMYVNNDISMKIQTQIIYLIPVGCNAT
jgi:hypothetical protein